MEEASFSRLGRKSRNTQLNFRSDKKTEPLGSSAASQYLIRERINCIRPYRVVEAIVKEELDRGKRRLFLRSCCLETIRKCIA